MFTRNHGPHSPYEHGPSVALTMGLSGGATATYDGDWASRNGDPSWNADWEIIGRNGRLLWSGALVEFRNTIAEGRRPETDAADNIHSLAAVLAAVQSADTGEIVRLDDVLQANV